MRKTRNIDLAHVVRLVRKARRILVATHVNPDGDGIGTMLALVAGFKSLKKQAVAYMRDPVPKMYRFLPGQAAIRHELGPKDTFDLSFIVDLGEVERVGEEFVNHPGRGLTVSLDHHRRGLHNADLNFCLPNQAASGEVAYKLLKALRVKLNRAMAVSLYTAIATDTGSFRYSNTTQESFAIATDLMSYKIDPWEIGLNCFEAATLPQLRLLERVLGGMTLHQNGRVAWIVITRKDMAETGASPEETEGFITYPRSIEGVEVALAFRESEPGVYKVSLRSKAKVDVGAVAESLGGGGHRRASGLTLTGGLDEVRELLLEKILPLVDALDR